MSTSLDANEQDIYAQLENQLYKLGYPSGCMGKLYRQNRLWQKLKKIGIALKLKEII